MSHSGARVVDVTFGPPMSPSSVLSSTVASQGPGPHRGGFAHQPGARNWAMGARSMDALHHTPPQPRREAPPYRWVCIFRRSVVIVGLWLPCYIPSVYIILSHCLSLSISVFFTITMKCENVGVGRCNMYSRPLCAWNVLHQPSLLYHLHSSFLILSLSSPSPPSLISLSSLSVLIPPPPPPIPLPSLSDLPQWKEPAAEVRRPSIITHPTLPPSPLIITMMSLPAATWTPPTTDPVLVVTATAPPGRVRSSRPSSIPASLTVRVTSRRGPIPRPEWQVRHTVPRSILGLIPVLEFPCPREPLPSEGLIMSDRKAMPPAMPTVHTVSLLEYGV